MYSMRAGSILEISASALVISSNSSGVKILSSGIGAMSVAAVIYFMGAPLATLLFYRLALGICASLLSFAGAVFGQRFFESVRCAVDCVIGVGASALTVYILNVAVFMSIVSGGGI